MKKKRSFGELQWLCCKNLDF